MKKLFSLFAALLCASVMTFAGSYTITFKDSGATSDSGTGLTSTTVSDYVEAGADYVSAISASGKVYLGATGFGLKFGNSSNPGSVTLTLSTAVKPTSIVMVASQYGPSEGSGLLQDETYDMTGGGGKGHFNEYTYEYDGETEVTSIVVGTTTKRGYVQSVTVNYASTEPSISANVESIDFGTKNIYYDAQKSGSETFKLTSENLTDDVEISLSNDNVFSVTPITITKNTTEEITVSFNVSTVGTHTATLTLESGSLSTEIELTVTAIDVTPVVYSKVTDESALKAGDKLIIVAEGNKRAAGLIGDGKIMGYVSLLNIADGEANITTEEVNVFTLGGATGAWTLTSSEGQLTSTTVKELIADGNGTWTITFDENGNAIIHCEVGDIKYNSSSPRFTTYASGQTDVQLYSIPAAAVATYDVTPELNPNGTITATPNADVEEGTTVTLTATPNDGYEFEENSWVVKRVDNNEEVTVTNNQFIMPASNVSVAATFLEEEVSTDCDWDKLEWIGDGSQEQSYGSQFKVCVGDPAPNVVNIQTPGFATESGIYMTFAAEPSSISLSQGQYSVQGAGVVFHISAFTAKETEVTVVANNITYVFTVYNVNGTESSVTTYAINVNSVLNGTISADVTEAAEGATVTLTATPDDGYEFGSWTVQTIGGDDITVTDNQFTMPASEVNVSATFLEVAVTDLTLSDSELSLEIGEEDIIIVTITPSNANQTFRIELSEEGIVEASIVGQTIVVEGLAAGQVDLTVYSYDNQRNATCVITVTAPKEFYTVAEIIDVFNGLGLAYNGYSDKAYKVRGYVTKWKSGYPDYQNADFFIDDTEDGSQSLLECYRVTADNDDDKRTLNVGDYVEVYAYLKNYNRAEMVVYNSIGTYHVITAAEAAVDKGDATVEEFLAAADTKNTYHLTGTVSDLPEEQFKEDGETYVNEWLYGNFNLTDETGTIYIYGLLTADGVAKQFVSLDIENGDEVTLKGVYTTHNDTPQIANAIFISRTKKQSTALDTLGADGKAVKVIENNQVIILRDGKRYNVVGIEVK